MLNIDLLMQHPDLFFDNQNNNVCYTDWILLEGFIAHRYVKYAHLTCDEADF